MQTYRIVLKPLSPFVSSLQADTLFGHLCWVIKYCEGEDELIKILNLFKKGSPPFLLSDVFPENLFPKPFHVDTLNKTPDKAVKKCKWLNLDLFERVRKGEAISGKEVKYVEDDSFILQSSTHNCINRITNTTSTEEGGSLYSLKEIFFFSNLCLYLKSESEEWKEKCYSWMKMLARGGYGKKKSIGKGQFDVLSIESFSFENVPDANSFVTFSSFCPKKEDPVEGCYKLMTKYGKMGDAFTFCGNPFKNPLIMIKSGSVFETDRNPHDFYGRMVEGISPVKKEVVQYAYSFSVPLKWGRNMNINKDL